MSCNFFSKRTDATSRIRQYCTTAVSTNASLSGDQTKAPQRTGAGPPVRPVSDITPVFSKVPVSARPVCGGGVVFENDTFGDDVGRMFGSLQPLDTYHLPRPNQHTGLTHPPVILYVIISLPVKYRRAGISVLRFFEILNCTRMPVRHSAFLTSRKYNCIIITFSVSEKKCAKSNS